MKCKPLGPDELISESGVYDLTMERYHGQPCVGPSTSSSVLRTIWSDSAAHAYLNCSMNPDREPQEDRPHFSLGRAAHHLLFLGKTGFDREFVPRPEKWSSYATNDSKAWKSEVIKAGLTIVTPIEIAHIEGMAKSLAAHPMVKAGILDGAVERSLIYRDPETGVWLKSRPDNIIEDSADYSDLKTTVSVKDDALRRTLAEYHYPMQGALVGEASRIVLDREMATFTLVFVEKAPPYCVRVVTLRPADLARGLAQVKATTRIFARCVETGDWPGPGGDKQDAEYLSPSDWGVKQVDERLAIMAADNDAHPISHAAE